MLTISQAKTTDEMDAVRGLMRSFVAWHQTRHAQYRNLIDKYFDAAAFEAELTNLPGHFAPPRGRLLVAKDGQNVVGCVALHNLGDGICEMKRMFVTSAHQGQGIGQALGARIIKEARQIGYSLMRLDTGPLQNEAQGLYERLGFRRTKPYYPLDQDMRSWLIFMELDLKT
ncbi:GNAT family N-acetyltransferase [Oceaniovalibus sp. ACAM 378]|jgi:GNAT superfamily N-acetyltransferase|uniref:GNAT family N-acetyltransferase n=1 Tax=Oceaniovalibus sp. ACAM 378 TaxID=2599923 RepID=UPI002102EAB5|nr:GNAT family N-acetyltransferase [Oceaniovalibus sp. ACAM 378]